VRVTLANGLEAIQARQGEIAAEAVRRLEARALIDTTDVVRLIPQALAEQLGLPICRRGIWYPDGAWREGEVAEFLSVELWGRPASMDALVMGEELRLGFTLLGQTDLRFDDKSGLIVPHVGTWKHMLFRV
jgi:hypothetical protein